MSGYAVRNDGVYGVRAVDGPEDCMPHETYSAEFVERTETLEDRLAVIESTYEARFSALKGALQSALLADGVNMEGTLTALRAEWASLSNAKSAEMAALLEA